MKILIIAWYYAPRIGGVETVARMLAKGAKKKNEVVVLTSSEKDKIEYIDGIKVIRTHYLLPRDGSNDFTEYVKNLIEKENIELVHCHNISYPFNPEKSIEIIKVCNQMGVPVIEHAHNAQLKQPGRTRKIIHSDIDRIICVSGFVEKNLIKRGVSKNKLEILNNPINTKLFDISRIEKENIKKLKKKISPEGYPIIFFPGRVIRVSKMEIGEQKQFKIVVRALKILKDRGVKFKLAIPCSRGQPGVDRGKISRAQEITNKFLELKNIRGETFIFKESLGTKNMPLAYAASDIVCMPSLNETFGMVFAEAQSMQRPIVAAKSGAAPFVISKKAGVLIKPGDYKELAIEIEKLIKNVRLRKKLGKEGRKRILKLFSEKKIVEKLLKIYSELCKSRTYFVRHPETVKNKNNKITGWEITKYSGEGKKQFKKILNFFRNHHEIIYSSDLPRCLELANAISRQNKSRLITSELLRERNFRETKPYNSFEDENKFKRRIMKFTKKYNLGNSIIISHSGVVFEIIGDLLDKKDKIRYHSSPRNTLFQIETNKKQKILEKREV
ncbi:MAG TPA: glycosyltransferase [Candidatus Paceibacterota bacterium]|nr:glycosyltransferase [Candidatus Paceibacterota bacterium]